MYACGNQALISPFATNSGISVGHLYGIAGGDLNSFLTILNCSHSTPWQLAFPQ